MTDLSKNKRFENGGSGKEFFVPVPLVETWT